MRATAAAGPTVRWSVRVVDAASDEVLLDHDGDAVLPTASVGKVLLLVEVAARLADGRLDGAELLDRRTVAPVADSGLWQHLRTDRLPVADLATLVGSVSDNLATNVLLARVGLDAVRTQARALGLGPVELHDAVRDERLPEHPATLSTASAAGLCTLLARLHRGDVVSAAVGAQVVGWLAAGADLSMVAAAWHLDPLAHAELDRGLLLRHKTGTDAGVRADAGLLSGPRRTVAYAVVASWDGDDAQRGPVLAAMRALGDRIAGLVGA